MHDPQPPRRDLSRHDDAEHLAFAVTADETGTRLDLLLVRRAPWRSRSWFRPRFAAGQVRLDGEAARPGVRVRQGQRVEVELGPDLRPDRSETRGVAATALAIVHEDEHLVVLDKPAGVVVHPVGGYRRGTLINLLHARYRRPDDPARDVVPTLLNRLDRDTSGLVAVALSDTCRHRSAALFGEEGPVEKTYLVLVEGVVCGDAGTWDAPVGSARGHHIRLRRAVDLERGQPATTHWLVRERFPAHTFLEVRLATGRKHQIRVHAAHAGHPVVADRIYGALRDPTYHEDEDEEYFARQLARLPIARQALHAYRLVMPHPITGATLRLEAPVPADLSRALATVAGSG